VTTPDPDPRDPGAPLDTARVRADFPALHQTVHGRPLVYMDSAATTLKPRPVIDAIARFYETYNANVHRATHTLAQRATDAYENARKQIADYINAPDPRNVIFTAGNTDALNLVAQGWAARALDPGDRILISAAEHHSNIVPWLRIRERTGAHIGIVSTDETGEIDPDALDRLLDRRTKAIAIPWVSNVLGTINPIPRIAQRAHAAGARLVVDGAQAIPHARIDVQRDNIGFLTLAGHKAFGPMGIGALYAATDLLEQLEPVRTGGEMVETVSFEAAEFSEPPLRFEAGTPNVAGAVGFAEALRYVASLGLDACAAHERDLVRRAHETLASIPGLTIHGTSESKAPIFTVSVEACHPADMAPLLDRMGFALRAGQHCAQPLAEAMGRHATLRASCAIYNTTDEIERLADAIDRARTLLS